MPEQIASGVPLFWYVIWLTAWIIGTGFILYRLMSRSISELKTEIGELRTQVTGLGTEITQLRERTSSLEGKVQLISQMIFRPETEPR